MPQSTVCDNNCVEESEEEDENCPDELTSVDKEK